MSKLFNLKEWLTLADAARHLSIVFGEEVSEADVLRFSLDGHLRLSVNFVNHARARRGQVVDYGGAKFREMDPDWAKSIPNLPDEAKGKPIIVMESLNLDGVRFLNLEEEVTSLHGVWDLPMIGGEQIDIEHQYQMLTGGPSVTLETIDGAFVEGRDGVMCQLQEDYDDNEYQAGSKAAQEKLKYRIAEMMLLDPTEKGAAEAEALLNRHEEERKKFQERRKTRPQSENYYAAGGLPKDSVLVIRTEALREFEQTVSDSEKTTEKPLKTTERNSLLTIIAALCDYSAIEHQGRGAASQVAKLTEELGAAVSVDTVRRMLAKIPDALETRLK